LIVFDKFLKKVIRSVQHEPKNAVKEVTVASESLLSVEKPQQVIP
jgi:hypothetical protein